MANIKTLKNQDTLVQNRLNFIVALWFLTRIDKINITNHNLIHNIIRICTYVYQHLANTIRLARVIQLRTHTIQGPCGILYLPRSHSTPFRDIITLLNCIDKNLLNSYEKTVPCLWYAFLYLLALFFLEVLLSVLVFYLVPKYSWCNIS